MAQGWDEAVFNYDDMNDEKNKIIVKEVLSQLSKVGVQLNNNQSTYINQQFKIEEKPKYDLEDNPKLVKWCEKNKIHLVKQGHYTENGKNYGCYSMHGEIREFERWFKDSLDKFEYDDKSNV